MEKYAAPNYIAYAIPVFLLLIGVELIVARFQNKKLYRLNDSLSDMSAGIMQMLVGVFGKVFFVGLYVFLYETIRLEVLFSHAGWTELARSKWVTLQFDGFWAQTALFAAAFVLYDHQYYWFHRLSHEVNFIWGSHVAHHSSEEYNLTVALRQGGFQGFFSFWFYVPLAVIGIHPVTYFVAGQFVTLYQFWIHTRTIDKMPRWFEAVFNTPSHHRVHHGRNPQYIDRNHAGTFIIWDKLYGSFEPEGEEVVYGITNPLGTWNPIWAQFHYWIEVWQLAKAAPKWRDKILVWFKDPGWMPEGMGPHKTAPPVDARTYEKFGRELTLSMNLYVLVNFVTVLGGLVGLLGGAASMSLWQQLGVAAFLILTMLNLGVIGDLRPYAYAWEVARLAGVGAVAAVYTLHTGDILTGSLLAGSAAAMLLWWIPMRRNFRSEATLASTSGPGSSGLPAGVGRA